VQRGTAGEAGWEPEEPAASTPVTASAMRRIMLAETVGMERCVMSYLLVVLEAAVDFLGQALQILRNLDFIGGPDLKGSERFGEVS